ncbi:MAG: M48 family metallopeptidase [Candidatus ainarchaeum sp.]|nr:M48 family metallopeptidase [Candidatus ainarchaeum sp.]
MESVAIGGRTFAIMRIASSNRNATARLKGETIVISLPSRWQASERERVGASLMKRAVRAIEKGRWKPGRAGRARFFHGQRLRALGREFEIIMARGKRFGAKAKGQRIEVRAAEHPDADTRISGLVRREITRELMPQLLGRVNAINETHFQASIPKVTVRDNLTRWGSCAPDGAISLNFRLLFMPERVLDYVIVHELAHTRYRSHGPRFWALVEKALPGHREQRKWLRENGHSVLADGAPQAEGWAEEPY